jgi:methyl acetate hydrolase
MSQVDDIVRDTVDRKVVPFLCAAVADSHGVRWQASAGRANSTHYAGSDTVFRIFSASKAIGSFMAIIAIDRGLLTMDTPIGDILPAFDRLQVLEKLTPEGPVFRKPKRRATLRHVLTHSQGQGYDIFYPLMKECFIQPGAPRDEAGILESLMHHLLFDPGEGFAYGIGTDWVGMIVSAVDGRPIDQFVREEILEPLGMTSTAFEAEEAGDRLAHLSLKKEDGSFGPFQLAPPSHPKFYRMGDALYSTPADYLKFLRMVLNRGEVNGTRLVGSEAMKLMLTDQMRGIRIPAPVLVSIAPGISRDAEIFAGARRTHTAGFFMNLDALPGRRGASSLSWAGILNTHYWIDPGSDIASIFFTQMLPFCDTDLMTSLDDFERAVYRQFARRVLGLLFSFRGRHCRSSTE